MPGAALPLASSAIGGIFSGIGASKPKTSTSTTDSKSTQEGVLDNKQSKVMRAMFKHILAAIQQGPVVSQADKDTANTRINNSFDAASDANSANLAARGMSSGGTYGKNQNKLQVDRLQQKQGAAATLQDQAVQKFLGMLGIGQNFIVPRTFNTTGHSETTGTMSGQSPFSSIGSGVSDLGSYLYLNKMMGSNGGGGGGGPFNAAGSGNSLGGSYAMPCAIAMELWGANDYRVKVLRAWLLEQAQRSWKWAIAVGIYKGVGRGVAITIRRVRCLRTPIKSLFEDLIVRAMNA